MTVLIHTLKMVRDYIKLDVSDMGKYGFRITLICLLVAIPLSFAFASSIPPWVTPLLIFIVPLLIALGAIKYKRSNYESCDDCENTDNKCYTIGLIDISWYILMIIGIFVFKKYWTSSGDFVNIIKECEKPTYLPHIYFTVFLGTFVIAFTSLFYVEGKCLLSIPNIKNDTFFSVIYIFFMCVTVLLFGWMSLNYHACLSGVFKSGWYIIFIIIAILFKWFFSSIQSKEYPEAMAHAWMVMGVGVLFLIFILGSWLIKTKPKILEVPLSVSFISLVRLVLVILILMIFSGEKLGWEHSPWDAFGRGSDDVDDKKNGWVALWFALLAIPCILLALPSLAPLDRNKKGLYLKFIGALLIVFLLSLWFGDTQMYSSILVAIMTVIILTQPSETSETSPWLTLFLGLSYTGIIGTQIVWNRELLDGWKWVGGITLGIASLVTMVYAWSGFDSDDWWVKAGRHGIFLIIALIIINSILVARHHSKCDHADTTMVEACKDISWSIAPIWLSFIILPCLILWFVIADRNFKALQANKDLLPSSSSRRTT